MLVTSVFVLIVKFYIYRNKSKEESRQEKLSQYKVTGKWPGMKSKLPEKVSWSIKVGKKERKADRKHKKELKRQNTIECDAAAEDDDDDLDEDYRLLKKMKKVLKTI